MAAESMCACAEVPPGAGDGGGVGPVGGGVRRGRPIREQPQVQVRAMYVRSTYMHNMLDEVEFKF